MSDSTMIKKVGSKMKDKKKRNLHRADWFDPVDLGRNRRHSFYTESEFRRRRRCWHSHFDLDTYQCHNLCNRFAIFYRIQGCICQVHNDDTLPWQCFHVDTCLANSLDTHLKWTIAPGRSLCNLFGQHYFDISRKHKYRNLLQQVVY